MSNSNIQSNIEKSFKEFLQFLQEKQLTLSKNSQGTYKISMSEHKQFNEENLPFNQKQNELAKDILKKLKFAIDFSKTFDTSAQVLASAVVEPGIEPQLEVLNINKKFSELDREGAKTAVEQTLLESVNNLLSPQEKQTMLNQDANLGQVQAEVSRVIQDLARIASETIQRENDKKIEKTNEEEKRVKVEIPQQKHGEGYGILDQLFQELNAMMLLYSIQSEEKRKNEEKHKSEEKNKSNELLQTKKVGMSR